MLPFGNNKPTTPDAQMELVEHLAELRARILRSLLYLAVAMSVTWFLNEWVFSVLAYPLQAEMAKLGQRNIRAEINYLSIVQPFLQKMQIAFVSGIVVAFPLVVLELWGFIAPALTEEERKPVYFLAPFSTLLFIAGTGLGYASLRPAFAWMASFIPSGTSLLQSASDYVLLVVKILLGFGISFQLPIVLLFLARVNIINSRMMTTYWRHAVVIIAAFAAILTPSNDPLTMLMMAVPMSGLYLLSISLVKAFEPKPDGTRSLSFATMITVAMAPVAILAAVGYWLWRSRGA
ncbi:MAG: twin-arginine translocase subunit TatC [Capsulimonadales bacterium]|nr:twin-arginine translocase subunit TatC [Capsulimonadales bacterium]